MTQVMMNNFICMTAQNFMCFWGAFNPHLHVVNKQLYGTFS